MTSLVKICGITREDQAFETARLGADLIGINYWPSSKRYLPAEKASWVSTLPETTRVVGVFVNPTEAYIDEIASMGRLDFVQLHGDESPEFCSRIAGKGLNVIKAFQVRDESSLAQIADFPVKHILLDAYHPTERGGLGETFPWELANTFKRLFPDRFLILAGGLTPDNVDAAVQGVKPFAVDVASGVESGIPGVKDMAKVAQFIRRAKAVAAPA